MIYFTSDLHLGHESIIKHSQRPFSSVEEMNDKLIKNINDMVNQKDDLYILGDFYFGDYRTEKINEFASKIKCKHIHLIRGNHDLAMKDLVKENKVFESISDYKEIKYDGRTFVLGHYPISNGCWNKADHGSYHLHGHVHGKKFNNYVERKKGILRYDVGVDANDYYPISIDSIIKFFECVNIIENNHHAFDEPGTFNDFYMIGIQMKHEEDYKKLDEMFVDKCKMNKLDQGIYEEKFDGKKSTTDSMSELFNLVKNDWFKENAICAYSRDWEDFNVLFKQENI